MENENAGVAPVKTPAPQLESLFSELRDLPREPPRREMLEGLAWKAVFRSPVMMALPILLMLMIFPFIILVTTKLDKEQRRITNGHILQVEKLGEGQTFVRYRYTVNGQNYTGGNLSLRVPLAENLKSGGNLPISYDKNHPQQGVPAYERAGQDDFPWPLIFVFPLFGLAWFASHPFCFPVCGSSF